MDRVEDGGIRVHLLLRKLAPFSVQFENSLKLEREFRVMAVSHLGSLSQGLRSWQRYLEHEEGEEGGSPALPQPLQIVGV